MEVCAIQLTSPHSPYPQPLATTILLCVYDSVILLLDLQAQLLGQESLVEISLLICFPPGCMRTLQTQGIEGREEDDSSIYIKGMRRNWCLDE